MAIAAAASAARGDLASLWSIAALTRVSNAVERAYLQLALGRWLRRSHRPLDARVEGRAALHTFDGLDLGPWAQQARDELRASGV